MKLSDAKQRFFALRNGLLADTLKAQTGDPHRLIFGLNLPQLMEIAAEAGRDEALADALWNDADCRESRLLAPMVCPVDADRNHWLGEVVTAEEADILCHRLLRHQQQSKDSAVRLWRGTSSSLHRYAALRLLLNLMPESKPEATELASLSTDDFLAGSVARQILEFE